MTRPLLVALALGIGCSPRPPAGEPPRPAPAVVATPSRVVTERFHSDALGVDKAVLVYLPRGYDAAATTRWPVLYYLHGLGGDETNWVKQGKLDAAADALGLAAIVVMPDGDDGFYIDSADPIDYDQCMASGAGLFIPNAQRATTCVRARRYETYVTRDLVGWVDGHYRTLARRDGRAIAGLSMGGFGAMAVALRHPDEFAAAASHSGALALLYRGPRPFVAGKAELITDLARWGAGGGPIASWLARLFGTDLARWQAHDVVALAGQLGAGKLALYFDCGSEDDFNLHDNLQYVHEALSARHIEHEYFLGPGKHDFAFWAARVPTSLAFLRDRVAKPQ
jgi:S-formylglutathione hydrolase FrmB